MADYIINDETPLADLYHPNFGRGLILNRPRGKPYAYGDVAEPFPKDLLIPRSEWQARIQEMEEQKSRITDLCDLSGLKVKNQEQTNYCWVNAPTHCAEVLRCLQGEPYVSLSPASAGSQITGYRNQGGWGLEALKFIVSNGLVPSSLWPDNAISKQYATASNLEVAKRYRVQEWWELEPGNIDQLISCLLRRVPVAVGLNWWSHEVTFVNALWIDNDIAVGFDNSWGTQYGTNGRGVLQGRRMLPDDAVAPRTALAA